MRYMATALCALVVYCTNVQAQVKLNAADSVAAVSDKYVQQVANKAEKWDNKIEEYTNKTLARFEKEERKLIRQLPRKDSVKAIRWANEAQQQYEQLRQQLTTTTGRIKTYQEYLPHLDSLNTSLSFLKNVPGSFSSGKGLEQVQLAQDKIKELSKSLQGAEAIKTFIRERKQQWEGRLQELGMVKLAAKYKKQFYYYSTQVKEYRKALEDPEKLERKTLQLLAKLPAFQQFMREHSALAALFPVPEGYGTMQALQGLQARADVQQLLKGQLMAGGPGAEQIVQQNIQTAKQHLNQLKDKVNQLGGTSSEIEMLDFRPNQQHTKSFLKRLEYGSNLQNTRGNSFFPNTTDLALSVGYKINDKSVAGIGASYKVGWGRDIRHVEVTHQGMGFRSFLDYKIKGGFWISGGGELNYRSQFEDFEILKDYTAWQKSLLLGLTKKYTVGKKLKGNVQLLYDFLWKQQVPITQPVLFRIGYNF